MARDMTALDYGAIEKHLTGIVMAAEGIRDTIKQASTKIESFNDSAPTKDATITAVAQKLMTVNEALKDIPEQLAEFNRSLKTKSESITAQVDEMTRGIADL